MIYVDRLEFPGADAEYNWIAYENRTCFHTFYPFKIFPAKLLDEVEFDNITMFYGGNGSGKSTVINILARKINAVRYSEFNDAPFFQTFVDMCSVSYRKRPPRSYVLTSDDVFDYALNARAVNENIEDKRNGLFEKYKNVLDEVMEDPETLHLKGLSDYERWHGVMDILSSSQSSYIRKNVVRDIDLYSNGETAMKYFLERIDEDAVYFLDEPENSLSIELQIELADYIVATARATKSQFIIATHSPIFLSMKDALIYDLDSYPAETCEWTDLPNVRRYFDFFMDHKDEFE